MTTPDPCPCQSGATYDACCAPCHAGQPASTALALMRSRYSAYVKNALDYIFETTHPRSRGNIDRAGTTAWAQRAEWQGLTIVNVQAGGPKDEEGVVEFIAHYLELGQPQTHHERSTFRKHEGRWCYVDGQHAAAAPVTQPLRAGPKPERNAPCPCGSGKKYKRCHG